MNNPILLVDTWESGGEIDELALKAAGISGMAIRLNDITGGHHLDENFFTQWYQAERAGMLRIVYFVYNPWKSGRENFLWLKQNIPAEARAVLSDIEVERSGYPPSLYAAEVWEYHQLVKSQWNTANYTGEWFLDHLAYWPTDADYWWAQYPNSLYPATAERRTWEQVRETLKQYSGPFNAYKVPGRLVMWQCSGDRLILPGCSKAMDVNVWMGTFEELVAFCGEQAAEPIPVDELLDVRNPFGTAAQYQKHRLHTGHGPITYHVMIIDVDRAQFFVTPNPSVRTYVPNYLERHELDIAINGDGWTNDLKTGAILLAGYAASEGKAYGRQGIEETIYIGRESQFSLSKPTALWNAISYPNRLVWEGKRWNITRTDVDPRTACGYSWDGKRFIMICVDGEETYNQYRTGMSFTEVADLLIQYGAHWGFMMDGGGSSTMAIRGVNGTEVLNVPCGEDQIGSLRMRRVANALGVRITTEQTMPPEYRKLKRILEVQGQVQNDTDQKGLAWTTVAGGSSGVTNRIKLTARDRELLIRLNPDQGGYTTAQKMKWAIWQFINGTQWSGGLYSGEGADGLDATAIWWPSIVECSKSALPGEFNTVKVLEYRDGFARIETLPPAYDPAMISPTLTPWLVQRVWVTAASGNTYDTPKGIFWMPLLDPMGRERAAGEVTGMWLDVRYLGEVVSMTTTPPAPISVPMDVKITGVPSLLGPKQLNIRESATMFNPGKVGFLLPGASAEVLEAVQNSEGVFFRIAKGMWICAYLKSKNQYFTSWRP